MATPKIDILVNLLQQLQPDPATTTLPLNDADQPLDYSRLIGNKVIDHDNSIGQLISSLNNLYSTITVLQGDVTNLYGAVNPVPDFAFPQIMGNDLLYSIEEITLAIGNQFLTLKNNTGNSTEITQAIAYQNQLYSPNTLASRRSLSNPSVTMSSLSGWVPAPGPNNIAGTLKNIWITVNDMRLATSNYLTYRGVSSCSAVTVDYSVVVNVPNQSITLFFVGNSTIPPGFVDVNSIGASLTISDGSTTPNIFTTFVNVSQANNNTNGVTINLSGTNINLYTTLTLDLVYNLTNNDLTCGGHGPIVPKTVTPIATPCVAGSITPLSATSFTASYFLQVVNQIITYKIETFTNPECTTAVSSSAQITTNPTTNAINYTISGLTTATTYYVKMTVAIGGNPATDCPNIQSITTL
jgi:hypothetical protein